MQSEQKSPRVDSISHRYSGKVDILTKLIGRKRSIPSLKLAVFIRQLATMVHSGMPLLRALEILLRQEKNRYFRIVMTNLSDNVRSGNALSDGLARYPGIFDPLMVSMVRAGEASGELDTILLRLARYQEKSLQVRKKITAALYYPVIVLLTAAAIVSLLFLLVIPNFQAVFDGLLGGAPLPRLTRWVIDTSLLAKERWWLVSGGLVIVWAFYHWLRRTRRGTLFFDRLYLSMPKIGDLLLKESIARFARTFGTLLSSGVPMLQALAITRDVVGNRHILEALKKATLQVRDGESLTASLQRCGIFPHLVTGLVEVGEETGELAPMLNRIADNYDEDVDHALVALTSLLEPLLILLLALVIGIIVIALFLPIIQILQNLSGG